jgi:hypothetical protein
MLKKRCVSQGQNVILEQPADLCNQKTNAKNSTNEFSKLLWLDEIVLMCDEDLFQKLRIGDHHSWDIKEPIISNDASVLFCPIQLRSRCLHCTSDQLVAHLKKVFPIKPLPTSATVISLKLPSMKRASQPMGGPGRRFNGLRYKLSM